MSKPTLQDFFVEVNLSDHFPLALDEARWAAIRGMLAIDEQLAANRKAGPPRVPAAEAYVVSWTVVWTADYASGVRVRLAVPKGEDVAQWVAGFIATAVRAALGAASPPHGARQNDAIESVARGKFAALADIIDPQRRAQDA